MAEKEEVGSIVVNVEANTSGFASEMAKLPGQAEKAASGIVRSMAGVARQAAGVWDPVFKRLENAPRIKSLFSSFEDVTPLHKMASNLEASAQAADDLAVSLGRVRSAGDVSARIKSLFSSFEDISLTPFDHLGERMRAAEVAAEDLAISMAKIRSVGTVKVEALADTKKLEADLARLRANVTAVSSSVSTAMNAMTQRTGGGLFKGPIQEVNTLTHELNNALTPALTRAKNAVTSFFSGPQQAVVSMNQLRSSVAGTTGAIDKLGNTSRATQKNVSFLTSNMVAQFQDVAVQAAAGTNVMQIALQQGTQMALVMRDAAMQGASLGAKLQIVGQAFLGLLGPTTLLPIAFTAAAAVALQFFLNTESAAQKAEKQLKEFEQAIKDIGKAFGVITGDLDDFLDKTKQLLRVELMAKLATSTDRETQAVRALNKAIGDTPWGFALVPAFRNMGKLTEIVNELGHSVLLTADQWQAYADRIQAVAEEHPEFAAQAAELLKLIEAIKDAKDETRALEEAQKRLNAVEAFGRKAIGDAQLYAKTLEEMSKIEPIEESTIDKIRRFREELKRGASDSHEWIEGMRQLEEMTKRVFDADQVKLFEESMGGALDKMKSLITEREGFRNTPYNDPTAEQRRHGIQDLAIGFGFHQIMDESGKTRDVVANDIMSIEEAYVQLGRQLQFTYLPAVLRAIGPDVWRELDDDAKAALADIAWNFGHIPKSVAEATKSLDKLQMAAAIRGLKTGGVNDERRELEALIVLGETRIGNVTRLVEEQQRLRKATDDYVLSAKNQLAVDELNSKLTFETAYERTRQVELLRLTLRAKEQNLILDEELVRTINAQAEALAREAENTEIANIAKANHRQATKEQIEAQRQLERAFQAVSDQLEDAFVSAIFEGEKLNDVIRNLIRSLAEMALRASLSRMFASIFNPVAGTLAPFVGSTLAGGAAAPAIAGPVSAGYLASKGASSRSSVDVNVSVAPSPLLVTTWDTKAKQAEDRAVARGPAVARMNSRRFGTP